MSSSEIIVAAGGRQEGQIIKPVHDAGIIQSSAKHGDIQTEGLTYKHGADYFRAELAKATDPARRKELQDMIDMIERHRGPQ